MPLGLSLNLLALTVAVPVHADTGTPPAAPASSPAAVIPAPGDEPDVTAIEFAKLRLDDGRPVPKTADDETIRLHIGGEYQVRYQAMRNVVLTPTVSAINAQPGLREDTLGQNQFAHHWLRFTPRLQLRSALEVVAQIDLLTGLALGDLAHDTRADQTPRDSYDGFSNVQPRWLYVDLHTPVGLFRVGQQGSHWGLGILANDGDHANLFGDYRYGQINERILFATKPGGKDSHFALIAAGDLVYRDNFAKLSEGDHAYQAVLAGLYERDLKQLGFYAVYRNQTTDRESGRFQGYTDDLQAVVLDGAGRIASRIPSTSSDVFAAAEAAAIVGSTNILRTPAQALSGNRTQVRSYGGAAQVGVVVQRRGSKELTWSGGADKLANKGDVTKYGHLAVQLEAGYASGDADPYDGEQKRFTIDGNHRVGLLIFDEMVRWQTARSATAAMDPLLSNAQRPTPGINLLPTNGGVSGAQYLYPSAVYRPRPWLDLRGAAVVAQATSDVVDPYVLATGGNYQNARKGDARRRDLGLELDLGAEVRVPLDFGAIANLGVQGGVLFPGGALANAAGATPSMPWLVIGRAGISF
jgi:hypothetical protein